MILLWSAISLPAMGVEPHIVFNHYYPEYDGEIWYSSGADTSIIMYYYRLLNYHPSQITKRIKKDSNNRAEKISTQKSEFFTILAYSDKNLFLNENFDGMGLYIIDRSTSISVGYCLLEQKPHFLGKSAPKEYAQIKLLTPNDQYLQQDLVIPENVTLNFYETVHDGFIERYGIAQMSGRDVVVLDAFYPAELESTLQPYIIEQLNKSVQVNPFDEGE